MQSIQTSSGAHLPSYMMDGCGMGEGGHSSLKFYELLARQYDRVFRYTIMVNCHSRMLFIVISMIVGQCL